MQEEQKPYDVLLFPTNKDKKIDEVYDIKLESITDVLKEEIEESSSSINNTTKQAKKKLEKQLDRENRSLL
jgi:hypothetical protein